MQRRDFAYDLPPELIAQTPLPERSGSRLLVLGPDLADLAAAPDAANGMQGAGASCPHEASPDTPNDHMPDDRMPDHRAPGDRADGDSPAIPRDYTMRDFPSLLRPGDLLVFNDTRVVAARLVGTKPSGGRVEIFLERVVGTDEALVQLRASKPIRDGLEVTTAGGVVRIVGRHDDLWRVEFPGPALEFFEQWGDVPLPPYIHRASDANDRERYQSIFARERGAVAAPTASLHFDSQLVREIEARGVSRAFVTLHVGAGTFQPVRTDDLESHVMHAERVSVSTATCEAIERTRAAGGRVVAIGTTVVRALESAALAAHAPGTAAAARTTRQSRETMLDSSAGADADMSARCQPSAPTQPQETMPDSAPGSSSALSARCLPAAGWSGETRLFIRPGFKFRVTDALLTNFHLPESTLLMLVCAFAGKDQVLAAYEHAVRARYRFFSYGDAMFLTKARIDGKARTDGKTRMGGKARTDR